MAIDINAAYDRNSHSHQSALLALKEASRATSLTISYGPGHDPTRVDESVALLNARPAPLLHEFHLQLAHVDDPIPISSDIFAGAVPKNLRSLMLFGCDLSSGSPLLSASLTALQIDRNCRIWPTVDDMVETLKGMPNLEEFIADCSHLLIDTTPSTIHPPHCVSLPHLKLLQLADNYPQAIKIFRHLNLPHNTQTCLLGSAPVPLPPSSEKTTMAALEHHFSSALASNASFSELDLVFQTGSFSLAANPNMESSFDVPPSDDRPLPYPVSSRSRFGFSFTVPTFLGYDIPLAVLQMSLFHRTTTLTVRDNDDSFGFGASRADPTLWSRMAAYKDVEMLEVTGRWAYSLVDALNRSTSCGGGTPDDDGSLMLFPRLRELVIEEVQFDSNEKDPERASFFARLMTGLDRHISAGTLTMVAITKCDVERRMVDALRLRLGEDNVDWDGRVRGKGIARRTMAHACRIGGIATPAQL
ncbi:hypothetical protein OF83DRAFT_1080929 [Amylostereum chailletii]|nr:hypothetical protein OF83DRAFT_1080929 [Amylostereum chailletii]